MQNKMTEQKLISFLKRIADNDYYKGIINSNYLTPSMLWSYYSYLPIMKKEDVVSNIYDYVSNDFKLNINVDLKKLLIDVCDLTNNHDKQMLIDKQIWNIEFTTGSTGKPFPIIKSPRTRMIESMYLLKKRRENFSKVQISNGFLFLHPTRPDILAMNLWEFKEEDMDFIINDWINNRPKWIFATPLVFYKYAEYIKRKQYDIFTEKPLEFIEYTSQSMNDEQKKIIDEIFNCKIFSNYGSREFWNIAYECINGNLHINNEYLIIDIIDDEGNLINNYNIIGDVVITNLINYDMPLLKYHLGDRAMLIKNNCNCGCNSDIIKLVPQCDNGKLKNTNLYGSQVFRRVMRGIYFHDYFDDVNKIKIIQDDEYHLTVYIDKKNIKDQHFETRFIYRTKLIVDNFDKFKITFVYEYPFFNEDYRFKEVIFKSII